jgi:hypothetical protein
MCLAETFALFVLLLFISNDNLIAGMFPGDFDWSQTLDGQEYQQRENEAAEKYRFGGGGTQQQEGGGGLLGLMTSLFTGGEDTTASSHSDVIFYFFLSNNIFRENFFSKLFLSLVIKWHFLPNFISSLNIDEQIKLGFIVELMIIVEDTFQPSVLNLAI